MNYSRADNIPYSLRIKYCTIIVLVLCILAVNFLPPMEPGSTKNLFSSAEAPIPIELIDITFQASSPPPPVRPRIMINQPDWESVDVPLDLDLTLDLADLYPIPLLETSGVGHSGDIVERPQRAPRVVRIVEAVTPEAVLQQNMRIEIAARFTVDQTGRVEEVVITEIKVREGPGLPTRTVQSVGFGVIEAVYAAGRQWQFRPATENGAPVRAYSHHIFAFGRD
jgi:hypothetical protein